MASAMPVAVKAQAPPISAISMKISSPAYMLPNSRMPCDTVLETNSTICIAKFTGYRNHLSPKGAVNSSCDPAAQALDLDVVVQADQQHAEVRPMVTDRSAVGTTRR